MAGKVRIMVGVRPEYRVVRPAGQDRVKQLHRPFPSDESDTQLGPLPDKMLHTLRPSQTGGGAIKAFKG